MTVGAVADREERPPMVKFERRSVEDKSASRLAGQIVYTDVDFVLVTPPYSKDLFEQKVQTWFKSKETCSRTPREWLDHWKKSYERFKEGEEIPLNGTSVKNWSAISQAECKTLIAANILTIEDLALVNGEGLRRLGMGANSLKNRAKDYVQAAKNTGPLVVEMAALRAELNQKDGTIQSLSEKIDILSQRLEAVKAQPFVEVTGPKIDISDVLPETRPMTVIDSYDDTIIAAPTDFSKMKMHEIRAECKKQGIKVSPSDKKVELIEKLTK